MRAPREVATAPETASDAPDVTEPLTRLLELEAELRAARSLLAVRDEAFHTLLDRLVETERLVHQQREALAVCDARHTGLEAERDRAVALAQTLEQLRLFRYTRAPRAAYGFVLRLLGLR